jgi:hypothetical protein
LDHGRRGRRRRRRGDNGNAARPKPYLLGLTSLSPRNQEETGRKYGSSAAHCAFPQCKEGDIQSIVSFKLWPAEAPMGPA